MAPVPVRAPLAGPKSSPAGSAANGMAACPLGHGHWQERPRWPSISREPRPRRSYRGSSGANAEHGLPRTNADKRRAVEMLLADEEWVGWSNKQIAKACCVNPSTVDNCRNELSTEKRQIDRKVERNGTIYTQRTENIGHSVARRSANTQTDIADLPARDKCSLVPKPSARTCTRSSSPGWTRAPSCPTVCSRSHDWAPSTPNCKRGIVALPKVMGAAR